MNPQELIDKTFGNYAIHGIDEIHIPPPVPWLPQTLAWKLLLALVLIALAVAIWKYRQGLQASAYRRAALQRLEEIQTAVGEPGPEAHRALQLLPALMKATALQAYPRVDVAALSGEQWLEFLDARYSGPPFQSEAGRFLLVLAYQSPQAWSVSEQATGELLSMCAGWLRKHRVDVHA